jgi:hypothetical protein
MAFSAAAVMPCSLTSFANKASLSAASAMRDLVTPHDFGDGHGRLRRRLPSFQHPRHVGTRTRTRMVDPDQIIDRDVRIERGLLAQRRQPSGAHDRGGLRTAVGRRPRPRA